MREGQKSSEIPHLRLRSHQELWSRSWHGWFLGQSFLVRNLFYNDIFCGVWDGQRKVSRLFVEYKHVFIKRSFAVSSMCLAHHAVHLWCSPRRWPRWETKPVQIYWNCATFPFLVPGKMAVFDKTKSLIANWVQWKIYYACSTPQVCCVHHALCCYFCCSVNPEKTSLMWSWVFFETERVQMLSGIHFTKHFIVETKRFVSSNVNVIVMRQICRQRSSMSAGSKRWAPTHLIRWKSALRSSIPFASPEVVHKPRSDSPLHFDSQNTCQICTGKIIAPGVYTLAKS